MLGSERERLEGRGISSEGWRARAGARFYKFLKTHRGIRRMAEDSYVGVARAYSRLRHPLTDRLPAPTPVVNTPAWVEGRDQGDGGILDLQIVRPGEAIHNPPPRHIHDAVDEEYRFAEHLFLPPAFVASLREGHVIGEHGFVVTADGHLLLDVAAQVPSYRKQRLEERIATRDNELRRDASLPARRVSGTVMALSAFAGRGYFHWLWDVLPKLGLLADAGLKTTEIDRFVVPSYLPGFQIETLTGLGIDRDRIIVGLKDRHVQAERLVVTSMVRNGGGMPTWAIDFVRQSFLPVAPKDGLTPSRLYIERKVTDHGMLADEAGLEIQLRKRGFVPLAMENFSLPEKAWLLGHAEAVIGPSGAGLSNVVFCQPGAKVVELRVRSYPVTETWDIANRCGLEFYDVLPASDGGSSPASSGRVSEDDVVATLDLAGL